MVNSISVTVRIAQTVSLTLHSQFLLMGWLYSISKVSQCLFFWRRINVGNSGLCQKTRSLAKIAIELSAAGGVSVGN